MVTLEAGGLDAARKEKGPDGKSDDCKGRRARALLFAKKVAAEGLICAASLASACGGNTRNVIEDSGPAEAGPDSDFDRQDSGPDSDQRPDADVRPDAEIDMDVEEVCEGIELLDCPTGNALNVEVHLHIGESQAVENVRITAVETDGFDHIVSLHCDSTGELFVPSGRVAAHSDATFMVDTAEVTLRWVGAAMGLSMNMRADVTTPCPE